MAKNKRKPWTPPADLPAVLRHPQSFPAEPPQGYPAQPILQIPDWHKRRLSHALLAAQRILHAAVAYFQPVRVYACFSGGYDSAAAVALTMHTLPWRAWWEPPIESAFNPDRLVHVLHINTGIGIEATRQYVRNVCFERGWYLDEIQTPESYEDLVLGKCPKVYKGGFPGPPMHGFFYQRLKERAIRIAVRAAKEECIPDESARKRANVMFVSGIRHDESAIRTGYQRCLSKVDSQIWINPLYWATVDDFREIRELYRIPNNPVKDRLGMSGECLCGAFSEPGELSRVRATCPQTADYLERLEQQVRAAGYAWGWEDPGPPSRWRKKYRQLKEGIYTPDASDFRPMCASCEKTKTVPVPEPVPSYRPA